MERFRQIFTGLERAHGCTYVDKKGADGLKVKGKSFVKTEIVTDKHWEDHLNGIEPSLGIIPINENNECKCCLLYTSPSPRDKRQSRMPSSA